MDDYMAKPVKKIELAVMLEKWCHFSLPYELDCGHKVTALPKELIVMAECSSQLNPLTNPHPEIINLRSGDAEEVHIPCLQ